MCISMCVWVWVIESTHTHTLCVFEFESTHTNTQNWFLCVYLSVFKFESHKEGLVFVCIFMYVWVWAIESWFLCHTHTHTHTYGKKTEEKVTDLKELDLHIAFDEVERNGSHVSETATEDPISRACSIEGEWVHLDLHACFSIFFLINHMWLVPHHRRDYGLLTPVWSIALLIR